MCQAGMALIAIKPCSVLPLRSDSDFFLEPEVEVKGYCASYHKSIIAANLNFSMVQNLVYLRLNQLQICKEPVELNLKLAHLYNQK